MWRGVGLPVMAYILWSVLYRATIKKKIKKSRVVSRQSLGAAISLSTARACMMFGMQISVYQVVEIVNH
jgi:hypothetical protein